MVDGMDDFTGKAVLTVGSRNGPRCGGVAKNLGA